jgi:hypothetical protein
MKVFIGFSRITDSFGPDQEVCLIHERNKFNDKTKLKNNGHRYLKLSLFGEMISANFFFFQPALLNPYNKTIFSFFFVDISLLDSEFNPGFEKKR